jgi:hypothetical protein
MKQNKFNVGDIITLKKKHPCGSEQWKILRVGADLKIECLVCGRVVLIERQKLIKRIK